MPIFSIEGNIGSGKSTLLAYLKRIYTENRNIIFLREPVDEWESIKDTSGQTMLQKFYQDQETYSFPFQMMAYISRLALLKEAIQTNPKAIIITERSLYTDKYVFAKMLYESGKMEDVNYQIYEKWFDTFAQDYPIDGIIYVNTNYKICNERIQKRSRAGESNIPIEYLENCETYHGSMMQIVETKKPNLVLDGNVDIYDNPSIMEVWVQQIHSYLELDLDQHHCVNNEEEYKLMFDGCSKGNPGRAGAGAVIYRNGEEIWGEGYFVGEKETNNVAEYMSLIVGLQKAKDLGIKRLLVNGDSLLVIKQMNQEYKVSSSYLHKFYNTAREIAKYFENIVYEHVEREKNTRADQLANEGLLR